MALSEQLFQIASLDPSSPIGIAIRLVAEAQAKDEKRRQGQRDRTARCRAKVTLQQRESNVTVTLQKQVLYNIGSTELSEERKIQPRNRGSRIPNTWKLSAEDLKFATDHELL